MKLFLNKNKNKKFVVLDIPLLLENKLNKKSDILIFFFHISLLPKSCMGISTQLATFVCTNTCTELGLGTLSIISFRSNLKVTGAVVCAKLTVVNKLRTVKKLNKILFIS